MNSFTGKPNYRAANPNMSDREYWDAIKKQIDAHGMFPPSGTMVEVDRLLRLLETNPITVPDPADLADAGECPNCGRPLGGAA